MRAWDARKQYVRVLNEYNTKYDRIFAQDVRIDIV
jgi:hypothetical protein